MKINGVEYSEELLQAAIEKSKKFDVSHNRSERYWAENQMLLIKARAQGIRVTEAEIDTYLKNKKKKTARR